MRKPDMKKPKATKEEIIRTLQLCAKKLKRSPTVQDLKRMTGLRREDVSTLFGTMSAGLRAAGLESKGPGHVTPTEHLLLEWAKLARQLGKLPTMKEQTNQGKHSSITYLTRFRMWSRVGFCFRRFAQQNNLAEEWQDVLDMVTKSDRTLLLDEMSAPQLARQIGTNGIMALSGMELNQPAVGEATNRYEFRLRTDRPIYGAPLPLPRLAHAPTNEAGVVYLFGTVAHTLGLVVHRIQTEFPDCEAMLEVQPGKWQRVRIEFEFASKNFAVHKHNAKECDMIVCWTHNWPECPENLEVVELSQIVRRM
jgi:hypothetical protein